MSAALVGLNTSTGQVTKSYATNIVSGYDSVGGLVGSNDGNISIAYSAGGGAIGHDQVGGRLAHKPARGAPLMCTRRLKLRKFAYRWANWQG